MADRKPPKWRYEHRGAAIHDVHRVQNQHIPIARAASEHDAMLLVPELNQLHGQVQYAEAERDAALADSARLNWLIRALQDHELLFDSGTLTRELIDELMTEEKANG